MVVGGSGKEKHSAESQAETYTQYLSLPRSSTRHNPFYITQDNYISSQPY